MKLLDKTITKDDKDIGYICIITYPEINRAFLQYHIDPEHQRQGIMSRELPLFLQECKESGFNQIGAMVKKSNVASIKILEQNNFVEFKVNGVIVIYIIDLRVNKKETLEMVKMFKEIMK